jgi:hypothetical protein
MSYGQSFVAILVALEIGATIWYISDGDWRRAIYWTAATAISVVVTW